MINPDCFTRINNDVNGNPRYVCYHRELLSDSEVMSLDGNAYTRYSMALDRAKLLGGKRFHNKQCGGGIVFCTYSLESLCKKINALAGGQS